MFRFSVVTSLFFFSIAVSSSFAQKDEAPLKIFGYFQNSFQHWTAFENHPAQNSFNLQQLNLFAQKDFGRTWTAFVNFEILNTFSSSRQWGAFNLEEAWVKYAPNMRFNLKVGLQIPTFNNLNEVKNRTPLLPYIIRPLVYETSFGEFFPIEDFVPARAFVQAYGFFPAGKTKFDYAVYLGNSPNINSDPQRGQTGVDTTTTFLAGGRLGIRHKELKLGLSATHEKLNYFLDLQPIFGGLLAEPHELPIIRLGGDLSYNFANFAFESEFIMVDVQADIIDLQLGLDFYYATLGYHFTEELFGYGSYWFTKARTSLLFGDEELKEDEDIFVPTMGMSYDLTDRIRLKGQFTRIIDRYQLQFVAQDIIEEAQGKFNIGAIAISVFF